MKGKCNVEQLREDVQKIREAWWQVFEPTARALGIYRLLDWLTKRLEDKREDA